MSVKKARKLRDALMIVGVLIIASGILIGPVAYLGCIVAFSSLIPHFLYNRCPHCGRQLGRNEGDYCQFCGGKLD